MCQWGHAAANCVVCLRAQNLDRQYRSVSFFRKQTLHVQLCWRAYSLGYEKLNHDAVKGRAAEHPAPLDSCSGAMQRPRSGIWLHLQWPTSPQAPWAVQAGERLEGMLVCRAGPGCNYASSAVSRCRQSDLPGTPRRIRATSAGTGRGATWGDVSHVALASLQHSSEETMGKRNGHNKMTGQRLTTRPCLNVEYNGWNMCFDSMQWYFTEFVWIFVYFGEWKQAGWTGYHVGF